MTGRSSEQRVSPATIALADLVVKHGRLDLVDVHGCRAVYAAGACTRGAHGVDCAVPPLAHAMAPAKERSHQARGHQATWYRMPRADSVAETPRADKAGTRTGAHHTGGGGLGAWVQPTIKATMGCNDLVPGQASRQLQAVDVLGEHLQSPGAVSNKHAAGH